MEERPNLCTVATKAIELIRTGLQSIADTAKRTPFPHNYLALVSVKYDPYQPYRVPRETRRKQTETVLALGNGFPTCVFQENDHLSYVKNIPIAGDSDDQQHISFGRPIDCARIVYEDDIGDGIRGRVHGIGTPSNHCFITRKIVPKLTCNCATNLLERESCSSTRKVVRQRIPGDVFHHKGLSGEIQDENLPQHCDSAATGKDAQSKLLSAIHHANVDKDVGLPPDAILEDTNDITHKPLASWLKSRFDSASCEGGGMKRERCNFAINLKALQTNKIAERCLSFLPTKKTASASQLGRVQCGSELPEISLQESTAGISKSQYKLLPMVKSFSSDTKEHTENTQRACAEYSKEEWKSPKQDIKEAPSKSLKTNDIKVGLKLDLFPASIALEPSSPDGNPAGTTTMGSRKKRPRPRRVKLDSDKKMWMCRKFNCVSKNLEEDDSQEDEPWEGSAAQSPCSPEMLVKAFGYDPTDDPFAHLNTVVSLPPSLDAVWVPILRRQRVKFCKDDNGDYIVAHRGTSSKLYLGMKNGEEVLVKDSSYSYQSDQDVFKEARIISLLNQTSASPHFYGLIEQGILDQEYSIVQRKCDGFNYLKELMQSSYYLSRFDWLRYCRNIASHLKTLHSYKVLHNNLCPENILVNTDTLEVKLTGFDLASYGAGVKLKTDDVQYNYGIAPEVKFGCITSPESDVYALGSVLKQVMIESRVMSLHKVVVKTQQALPVDRPQADQLFSMLQNLCLELPS